MYVHPKIEAPAGAVFVVWLWSEVVRSLRRQTFNGMNNGCCLLGVSVIILLRTQSYKPLECLHIKKRLKRSL